MSEHNDLDEYRYVHYVLFDMEKVLHDTKKIFERDEKIKQEIQRICEDIQYSLDCIWVKHEVEHCINEIQKYVERLKNIADIL